MIVITNYYIQLIVTGSSPFELADRIKETKTFSNAYPGSEFKVISPDNIYEYLVEGEGI